MRKLPPEFVKAQAGSQEALAVWVEQFAARAERLLAAFKHVRTKTPALDQAKTTATYALELEGAPKTLRMVKIGRHWYFGEK